jgi:hypothetical protein
LKPTWANSCETLSEKYPIQNRAGRVAQVIELLPSKCEAMSSSLSTDKKKLLRINMGETRFSGPGPQGSDVEGYAHRPSL